MKFSRVHNFVFPALLTALAITSFGIEQAQAAIFSKEKAKNLDPLVPYVEQEFLFNKPDMLGAITVKKEVFLPLPFPTQVVHTLFGCISCIPPFPSKLFHFGFRQNAQQPIKLFGFSDNISFSEFATFEVDLQTPEDTFLFSDTAPISVLPIQEAFNMIPDIPEFQDLRNRIEVSEGGFIPVMMTQIPSVPESNFALGLLSLGAFGVVISMSKQGCKSSKARKNK